MSAVKTNAMRILDINKINYRVYEYDINDGKLDGVSVAKKIGQAPSAVFKTLAAIGASKNIYIFVIPVEKELDLKAGAKAVSEKNIEMLKVSDIEKITGYVKGGCSPIGMKKRFKTLIHCSANDCEKIIISAGKIGLQIELNPCDLVNLINAETAGIIT